MKISVSAKTLPSYSFSLLLGVTLALSACGHPATKEECQEILRRTAELELSGRLSDDQLIKSELQQIEQSMQEPMMKKCVGKRITKGALKCVREAKTSEELSRDCFR